MDDHSVVQSRDCLAAGADEERGHYCMRATGERSQE